MTCDNCSAPARFEVKADGRIERYACGNHLTELVDEVLFPHGTGVAVRPC